MEGHKDNMYKQIGGVWLSVEGETNGFVIWSVILGAIGGAGMFLAITITNAVIG